MNRQQVIKILLNSLEDGDISVISYDLCEEAFKFDRDGSFYITKSDTIAGSLGLGLALGTDKIVFIFTSDNEFLKTFGMASQIAVSKCKNIFYVILHNSVYNSLDNYFNIFSGITSPKGMFFNIGFLVHDYTNYFQNKTLQKSIPKIVKNVRGPLAILVEVDKKLKADLVKISYSEIELKDRLMTFMSNSDLKTSLFEPPKIFTTKELEIKEE